MFGQKSTISIIGAGRLGSSLAIALTQQGLDVAAVSTRRSLQRTWLSEQMPRTRICEAADQAASSADIVFITTSDSAIETVCRQLNWQPHQAIVHCSGVLGLEVLRSASSASATVGAFHPLQTFPTPASHRLLSGITFAIESNDERFENWLSYLASIFGGKTISVSGADERAAYHASAVLACGMLAGLVGLAAELWDRLGIDRADAIDMMAPMITSTAAQVADKGVPASLTGPYTRGDLDTIRKHLYATQLHSVEVSRAYASLALAQLHIAAEQGGIDASRQREIRKTLERHLRSL